MQPLGMAAIAAAFAAHQPGVNGACFMNSKYKTGNCGIVDKHDCIDIDCGACPIWSYLRMNAVASLGLHAAGMNASEMPAGKARDKRASAGSHMQTMDAYRWHTLLSSTASI